MSMEKRFKRYAKYLDIAERVYSAIQYKAYDDEDDCVRVRLNKETTIAVSKETVWNKSAVTGEMRLDKMYLVKSSNGDVKFIYPWELAETLMKMAR